MERFPRLFTPEEANATLSEIRPLLADAFEAREEILRLRPDMEPTLEKAIGNGHNLGSHEVLGAFDKLKAALEGIQSQGVLVKDVNSGLLDFPSMREGRVVFLCWRYGEPSVSYWHDVDAGFAGRQPL
jgi:hypothetical protein